MTFTKARVVSVCPGAHWSPRALALRRKTGYTSTALNNFSGTLDPKDAAKILVRAAVEGPESEIKTASFWNYKNEQYPW